jgi:hypothetical protein
VRLACPSGPSEHRLKKHVLERYPGSGSVGLRRSLHDPGRCRPGLRGVPSASPPGGRNRSETALVGFGALFRALVRSPDPLPDPASRGILRPFIDLPTVCPLPGAEAPFGPMAPAIRSCSAFVVSHHPGGLLHTVGRGFVAPRCQSWGSSRCGSPGPSPVAVRRGAGVIEDRSRDGRTLRRVPSSTAAPHHCGRCLRAVAALREQVEPTDSTDAPDCLKQPSTSSSARCDACRSTRHSKRRTRRSAPAAEAVMWTVGSNQRGGGAPSLRVQPLGGPSEDDPPGRRPAEAGRPSHQAPATCRSRS